MFTYTDPDGWVSLGTYTFNGTGTVVLTRGSDGPDDWTIADQVKFKKADHEVVVDNPVLDFPLDQQRADDAGRRRVPGVW